MKIYYRVIRSPYFTEASGGCGSGKRKSDTDLSPAAPPRKRKRDIEEEDATECYEQLPPLNLRKLPPNPKGTVKVEKDGKRVAESTQESKSAIVLPRSKAVSRPALGQRGWSHGPGGQQSVGSL